MANLFYECVYVFIISAILIHIGHLIYDFYEKYKSNSVKHEEKNKQEIDITQLLNKENDLSELNIEPVEITDSDNKENNNNEIEKENNTETSYEKEKENNTETSDKNKINIKKNNSLNSMEELNDIKSSLNQMLNNLNKTT